MNESRPSAAAEPSRRQLGAHPDPRPRGLVLRIVRRLVREGIWILVLLLDLGRRFGTRLLQTEYKVAGGCKQRGVCCHHILLEWSPLLDRHRWLQRLVLFKMTRIYNFFDRGYTWEVEDGLMTRVLGCHSLRPDGRCGEYRIRPLICRSYPELPLIGKPRVLRGCGYRFVRRDGQDATEEVDGLVQIGRARRLGPSDESGE